MSKLFGTDGVRGLVGEELTADLAFKIGLCAGSKLKDEKNPKVIVGRDTRLSGSMLKSALAAGYMSVGVDVIDLGVVPTPTIAYLIKELGFTGGAMISASHNPYYDNGIKIFDDKGFKLSDEEEEEIEEMIFKGEKPTYASYDKIGNKTYAVALKNEYESYLKSIVDGELNGIKIAIDCGNGALSEMAPRLLSELGARVYSINTKPDGKNINDACGSTNPQLIASLTVENNCDIGFSFDGDADRVIAADDKGNIIDGDHIMAIYAQDKKNRNILKNDTIVATVMSNMGLDDYLKSIGVDLIRANVGDRYVLESMIEGGYVLGGEQSGHLIFLRYNTTGDGMASALHLLRILRDDPRTSSELNELFENYPQILVNANVSNKKKYDFDKNENIKEAIDDLENRFKDSGRVNVRASGTEPKVRVMVEGRDQAEIEEAAKSLVDLIEKELA